MWCVKNRSQGTRPIAISRVLLSGVIPFRFFLLTAADSPSTSFVLTVLVCAPSSLFFLAGGSFSSTLSPLNRALRRLGRPAPFIPIGSSGERVRTMDIVARLSAQSDVVLGLGKCVRRSRAGASDWLAHSLPPHQKCFRVAMSEMARRNGGRHVVMLLERWCGRVWMKFGGMAELCLHVGAWRGASARRCTCPRFPFSSSLDVEDVYLSRFQVAKSATFVFIVELRTCYIKSSTRTRINNR